MLADFTTYDLSNGQEHFISTFTPPPSPRWSLNILPKVFYTTKVFHAPRVRFEIIMFAEPHQLRWRHLRFPNLRRFRKYNSYYENRRPLNVDCWRLTVDVSRQHVHLFFEKKSSQTEDDLMPVMVSVEPALDAHRTTLLAISRCAFRFWNACFSRFKNLYCNVLLQAHRIVSYNKVVILKTWLYLAITFEREVGLYYNEIIILLL